MLCFSAIPATCKLTNLPSSYREEQLMEQGQVVQNGSDGEEKRRNTRLIIGIVVLVVLCLCLLIGAAVIGAYTFFGINTVSTSSSVAVTMEAMTVEMPTRSSAPTDTPISPSLGEGLPGQIDAGQVTLDTVNVSAPDRMIGSILSVEVTNPENEEVTVTIPCGLIFEPEDSGEQRLMAIQETSATVPAGGSSSVEAVVACIDSSRSTPSGDAGYTVGTSAEGDLLVLATCLCQRDLNLGDDVFGGMGTQFAVWSVSDGTDLSAMLGGSGESEGAMGDLLSGELGDFMQQFLGPSIDEATTILDECGVGN